MPIAESKHELRQRLQKQRLAVMPTRAAACAQRAVSIFKSVDVLMRCQHVALYSAVRGEISAIPLAQWLRQRGVAIAYPRMAKASPRRLEFHWIDDETQLVPNAIGIPEPTLLATLVPARTIECIVVPGLAFDAHGGRLGWGRAYYDTTLSHEVQALRVGLAYEFQLVADVPQSTADVRMDFVITEDGVRATGIRPLLELGGSH